MIKKILLMILISPGVAVITAQSEEFNATSEKTTALPPMHVTGSSSSTLPLNELSSTGSRLGLTLMETPATVDVITSETMRERGFSTTIQALSNAPGVSAGQCFGIICYSMRGFSGTLSLPFLFNGRRYPGLAISPRSTFNYERIEVIKGPSSVLHGFGAVTGAVNYVTKPADGKKEVDVEASYGSWDTWQVGVGAGGRFNEDTAYRADLHYRTGNQGSLGFVDHTRYEDYHVSGELAYEVTDNFKISLSTDLFKDQGEGYFGTPLIDGKLDRRIKKNNYNFEDDRVSKEVAWAYLKMDWKINESLSLLNETYGNHEDRFWHNTEAYNFNAATGLIDRGDYLHITHDQSIVGNRTEVHIDHPVAGMRNRFLLGFDYSFNRHQRDNNSPYAGSDSVDVFSPVPGTFNSPSPFLPQRLTKLDSYGVYLENLTDVTDVLKVSLSFRYDISDLKSFDLRDNSSFSKSYSGDSWRAGLMYEVIPDLTLYAQWSSALEPPSQIVTLPEASKDFELTEGTQWEVGMKGSFLDGRVNATLSLFDITRTNILTRDPVNPNLTQQVGEQSSRGVEIATAIRPTEHWLIDANYTILDAQFDNFNDRVNGVAVSRAGNLPPDVPEQVANVWLTWYPTDKWRVGAGVHYEDRRAANNANSVFLESYTLLNAFIGRDIGPGNLTLHLRNLTDEVYANRSYNGGNQVLLGEPLAFDVTWSMQF